MSVPSAIATILQAQLGDQDTNTLAPYLNGVWDTWASKNQVTSGLQFQYARRSLVDILIGQVWPQVTSATGDQKSNLEQKMTNLQLIRDNCEHEIERLEKRAKGNRAIAVGMITTTAPLAVTGPICTEDTSPPDPNDPGYRGDPQSQTWTVVPF
jgi:hypothetical protein